MRLDDAVHHRQTQPGALAHRLGGEKRLEDVRLRGLVHATAVVADPDMRIPARRRQAQPLRRGGVQRHGIQADDDAAAATVQRVPGVGAQVHQHLLQLGGVGVHPDRAVIGHHLQCHPGRQGGAQQLGRFFQQRVQCLLDPHLRLLPAEGDDLVHQVAAALTGLLDLRQPGGGRVAGIQRLLGQRPVAQDHRQDVVEVMRDAAGQRADGFHLLRLQQLAFQCHPPGLGLLALGDVGDHRQPPVALARLVEDRAGGQRGPQVGAVLAPEAQVRVPGVAGVGQRLAHRGHRQAAGVVHEVGPRPAQHLACLEAQHLLQLGVDEGGACVGIDHPDAFVGGVDDAAVARRAVAQLPGHRAGAGLGPFAAGEPLPGQQRQHQAQAAAGDGDDARTVVAVLLVEGRCAAYPQGPGVAGKADVFLRVEAGRVRRGGGGIGGGGGVGGVQPGGRRDVDTVVHLHVQAGRALAIQAGHQVVDAEAGKYPAGEPRPPLGHADRRRAAGVQRQEQQEARVGRGVWHALGTQPRGDGDAA